MRTFIFGPVVSVRWISPKEKAGWVHTPLFASSVQFSSLVLSDSLWPHGLQLARLPCPNSMSIESVMPSNHLILCHPLLLWPSILPSIRAFSNESVLHIRWPKYWSFSFSISPCNEYSGLISLMFDWHDLLTVQETLKSLFQHHNLKALNLQHSAFFVDKLSYDYWKNHSVE